MKQKIASVTKWIKDYISNSGAGGVVVGMSGGKDSFVVAKLCTVALGKENVYGVIMPNGEMPDQNDAVAMCQFLGIKYSIIDIKGINELILNTVSNVCKINNNAQINTPPRIRMTILYAVAASFGYLVANTSNLSEISIGYSTKWGDGVGDFAPLANLTKTEVCQMGLALGLPQDLVEKAPSDGLTGKTDEENLGITYENLDSYIRTGKVNIDTDKILRLHEISTHKRVGVAKFDSSLKNWLEDK